MAKKNATRRALFVSIMSLILCCAMLMGTTFAWFTDSVTNTGNKINAGNLDIELYMYDEEVDAYVDISNNPNPIFGKDGSTVAQDNNADTLWEPGKTQVAYFKLVNNGSLALKYNVDLNVKTQNSKLYEVMQYAITPDADPVNNVASWNGGNYVVPGAQTVTSSDVSMEPKVEHYFALSIHMDENAGNAYQKGDVAFDLTVLATQLNHEFDSFGPDYDGNLTVVTTTAELVEKIQNARPGERIMIAAGTYEIPGTLSIPTGVSLYGAQAGVAAADWANDPDAAKTVLKSTGANVLEIRQSSEDPAEATSNITIDGIMIDCGEKNVKGIYVKKSDGEAMEGIKIVNCAVVDSMNDGIDVCNAYGPIVENNYVENVKDCAIHLGSYNGYHYETWHEVTAYVRNNVIDGVTATESGAIQIENGMGDVVVSGNVIKNVTSGSPVGSSSVKTSAIHVYDVYEGGEIMIENNTIENANQGIAIYKYTYGTCYEEDWWEGPTENNDGVTIKNNTISGFTNFGIATSHLNEKGNTNNKTCVVITGNVLSGPEDKAIVIGNENTNWDVIKG